MSRFLCENCRTYLDAPQKICPNCGNTLLDSPPLYAHILFQATILAILAAGSCTFISVVENGTGAPYTILGGFPNLLVLIIILFFLIVYISIRRKNLQNQSTIPNDFESNYPRQNHRYIPPISPSSQRALFTLLMLSGGATMLFNAPSAPEAKLIVFLFGACTIIASIYGYYWRYKE